MQLIFYYNEDEMDKNLINKLFSKMCCSGCKEDFTDDSIKIMRKEDELFVIQVTCAKCGKTFGTAFFGHCSFKEYVGAHDEELALEIQEGPPPICEDDVLDAHKFIRNLEDDWQKYIPENLKKQ